MIFLMILTFIVLIVSLFCINPFLGMAAICILVLWRLIALDDAAHYRRPIPKTVMLVKAAPEPESKEANRWIIIGSVVLVIFAIWQAIQEPPKANIAIVHSVPAGKPNPFGKFDPKKASMKTDQPPPSFLPDASGGCQNTHFLFQGRCFPR
jgi:hypothetical protein